MTTLQRAVDCTKRQALDYATIVDREVIELFTSVGNKNERVVKIKKKSICEAARMDEALVIILTQFDNESLANMLPLQKVNKLQISNPMFRDILAETQYYGYEQYVLF